MSLKTYAILNDIHIPYQTKDLDLVLKILRDIPSLSRIYLNGDIGELESVSSHLRSPSGISSLKKEAKYINFWLDRLQSFFPRTEIVMIQGNHEYRLDRYLWRNAPALDGIEGLTIKGLLKLRERGIRHVEYGPKQLEQCGRANLWLRHEPCSGGQNPAANTAKRFSCDIAFGHTHIYQQYSYKLKGPTDRIVTATSLGFLGNIDSDIFNYRGSKDMWVNGFGLVQCEEDSGKYRLDFVELQDGLAIYGGKVYRRGEKLL